MTCVNCNGETKDGIHVACYRGTLCKACHQVLIKTCRRCNRQTNWVTDDGTCFTCEHQPGKPGHNALMFHPHNGRDGFETVGSPKVPARVHVTLTQRMMDALTPEELAEILA
jgi:hypothetical protein